MKRGHAGFQASQAAKKKIMFGTTAKAKAPPQQTAAPAAPADPAAGMGSMAPNTMQGGNFGGSGGM